MAKKEVTRKYLKWNAPFLLAKTVRRKDRLTTLLNELGVDISSAQVGRIINERPKRINIEVLEGLCSAFDCTPDDLFTVVDSADQVDEVTIVAASKIAQKPTKRPATKSDLPPDPPDFD